MKGIYRDGGFYVTEEDGRQYYTNIKPIIDSTDYICIPSQPNSNMGVNVPLEQLYARISGIQGCPYIQINDIEGYVFNTGVNTVRKPSSVVNKPVSEFMFELWKQAKPSNGKCSIDGLYDRINSELSEFTEYRDVAFDKEISIVDGNEHKSYHISQFYESIDELSQFISKNVKQTSKTILIIDRRAAYGAMRSILPPYVRLISPFEASRALRDMGEK